MPEAERIVVVRAGALGDFLLGIPALRALRQRYPRARLHLFGPMPQAKLAAAMGVIDSASSVDGADATAMFEVTGDQASPPGRVRACDLAIVWLRRQEPVLSNLRRAGAERALAANPFPDEPCHVADWLLRTLEPLGIRPPDAWDAQPWLWGPAKAREEAAGWHARALGGARYAVLHAGSGSARKNWPAASWAAVWSAMRREFPLKLVVSGGPADAASLTALKAALADTGIVPDAHVLEPSLELLAAILAGAALYLGNDSGVSHLAAGAGAPTVAVFGASDPLFWRPRGPCVQTLGGAGVGVLPTTEAPVAPRWPNVDAVIAAAVNIAGGAGQE